MKKEFHLFIYLFFIFAISQWIYLCTPWLLLMKQSHSQPAVPLQNCAVQAPHSLFTAKSNAQVQSTDLAVSCLLKCHRSTAQTQTERQRRVTAARWNTASCKKKRKPSTSCGYDGSRAGRRLCLSFNPLWVEQGTSCLSSDGNLEGTPHSALLARHPAPPCVYLKKTAFTADC